VDFTSQDAIDAAQCILRSPRMLVGAPMPPAQAPSPVPVPRALATVRTLGPDDPPPFDRVFRPHFSARATLALALTIIFVLPIVASVLTTAIRK
jgi:hypothetical protein